MSQSYAGENREMRRRSQGAESRFTFDSAILTTSDISYGESETSRRPEPRTGAEDPPYSERFPTQSTPAVPAPQPAYSTGAGSATYPGSVYASGSSYRPGPGYQATSGYLISGHPGPSYSQAQTYPSAGGYRDPREEPRKYSISDSMATRMDPRDPRSIPSYYSHWNSDMPMQGAVDDLRSYDHIPSTPHLQSGRGGYLGTPSVIARGYDPRQTPQMRDGHGTTPVREERRRRQGPGNHESEGLIGDWQMHYSKGSGSGHIASDAPRPDPVGEEAEGWSEQGFGEDVGEKNYGSILNPFSNEDPPQASGEKSTAIPDEEAEWSGISSSDDDIVRQQSHIFIRLLHST